ncbi:MAG: glutamate-5-semialdehyde dehydrogenase [Rhodospirillaceae bacterium]|jgi:glutamate-5-semialdehyde dehydrogenase|nr:glutamate-5-semialdehyde dehydrogenase [Rhodospirillaceae bacterium]
MTLAHSTAEQTGLEETMAAIGRAARIGAAALAQTDGDTRAAAIRAGADALRRRTDAVLTANRIDLENGAGLDAALRDRLALDAARIAAVADGLETIADQPDPLARGLGEWERPNGLRIARVPVPIGVIGIIYESRPNVTADAGALCLKSGNAAILRPGSESRESAAAILAALHEGLDEAGLPREALQMVPVADRAAVGVMLGMTEWIDLIVPRGGRGLIERILAESRIPVIRHLDGLNHTYLHAAADPEKARRLVVNAKMRRPGICGATETVLVDRAAAAGLLPAALGDLVAAGCAVRGDETTCALFPDAVPAEASDWDTEYLAPVISVRVVDGIAEALAHIADHGSGHTEAIVTEDEDAAARFLRAVDSGIVMHNASTQFADGGEFGMGAEIGISTSKLHVRGPVGAEQLTSYKYLVRGTGQTRP